LSTSVGKFIPWHGKNDLCRPSTPCCHPDPPQDGEGSHKQYWAFFPQRRPRVTREVLRRLRDSG
jgi:hypothetical protein